MYNIKHTDITKTDIEINEGEVDNSTDFTLFGRIKLEYGQELNENLLHLLENFAAPEIIGSTFISAIPNFNNATYNKLLQKPSNGQLWFNTTRNKFYFWDGAVWFPITNGGDYAANWGVISDGYPLPKPVSATTGYVFDYSECIWSVAPSNINGRVDYITCATDDNALVTSKYRYVGDTIMNSSVANYLIIGIRSNTNLGTMMTPPIPTPTPTSTSGTTPTPTITPSTSEIPVTASPTPTPTPTITPTQTITPTTTRSVGATPPATPTNTPTQTPTQTRTPSQTPTQTRTPTPTPSRTPSESPAPISPLSATWVDGFNPPYNQTMNSLYSYCDKRNHPAAGDLGVNCSGAVITCAANSCAPEPGDNGAGQELKITVTGGTAPYTVRFTNWTGSFSDANGVVGSQCVILATGNIANNLVVPTNSNGTIVAPSTGLTMTRTIASSGGFVSGIHVTSKCANREVEGGGTLEIIITDSSPVPKTLSRTFSWYLAWLTGN